MTPLRRVLVGACLLAAPFLAGCASPQQSADPGPFMLSGSLAEDVDADDVEELRAVIRSFDGEPIVLDTQPPQFQARGLDPAACRDLRLKLEELAYVTRLDGCAEQVEGIDAEPTGIATSPEPA